MKEKFPILLTTLLISCLLLIFPASASAIQVDATSAILIDANTGRIIYQQNAHKSLPIASTTKVLTALLLLENIDDLSQTVTVPADFVNAGEASIWLEPGETVKVADLLYAMLLRSANDAAQMLAITVAGSEEAFADMMNQRTVELGLKDSHWVTAYGLQKDGHYSSAYDLAFITKQAMTIPKFNQVIVTRSWTMPWANNDYNRVVYNIDKWLDKYEGADGGKTGYTKEAGSCLIASATRNDMRLIGVVLHCSSMYDQMASLMDYGFTNYQSEKVASAGDSFGLVKIHKGKTDSVKAVLRQDALIVQSKNSDTEAGVTIDIPSSLTAPVDPDKPIGTVTYDDGDGGKAVYNLYSDQGVDEYTFGMVLKQSWERIWKVLVTS